MTCRHPQRYRVTVDGITRCRRCHRILRSPRPGAGRPPVRGTPQTHRLPSIKVTEAELAEIRRAVGDEPLGPWIVEAALRRARGGRG